MVNSQLNHDHDSIKAFAEKTYFYDTITIQYKTYS